jgi:hypothetical protein
MHLLGQPFAAEIAHGLREPSRALRDLRLEAW